MIHFITNNSELKYNKVKELIELADETAFARFEYPECYTRTDKEKVEVVYSMIENYKEAVALIFSSDLIMFMEFRCAVKEGKLGTEDIKFYFIDEKGKLYTPIIDSDGRFEHTPKGWFDTHLRQMRDLL